MTNILIIEILEEDKIDIENIEKYFPKEIIIESI